MTFNSNLDLNNGQASRILVAIGFAPSIDKVVYTHGEMPIDAALVGIERAKTTLVEDDLKTLAFLEEEARAIKAAGGTQLTWR